MAKEQHSWGTLFSFTRVQIEKNSSIAKTTGASDNALLDDVRDKQVHNLSKEFAFSTIALSRWTVAISRECCSKEKSVSHIPCFRSIPE